MHEREQGEGRLAGKVVLVTGGARGQGAADALLFAQEGARVVLGDLLDSAGEQHAAGIRELGLPALYTHLDVTSTQDWDAAVLLAEREFDRLDVLVNNAGISAFAGAADATDSEWNRVIAVNQTGTFYGVRAAIPAMRRSGGGSIINIASAAGLVGVPGYFAYQASKGAVVMMTRGAAVEYAPEKIRVNSICPGLIYTDMTLGEPEEAVAANLATTPLGRGGEPMEVAYAALYLASDESAFVTGAALAVDGGYVAQ